VVQGEADRIRLARPNVGPEELAAVAEVLESGTLTMAARVAELEVELDRVAETLCALLR